VNNGKDFHASLSLSCDVSWYETVKCSDCGCAKGQLHRLSCFREECPFCGGQLVACDCRHELLGLKDFSKYGPETSFMAPEAYEDGLTPEQEEVVRLDCYLDIMALIDAAERR